MLARTRYDYDEWAQSYERRWQWLSGGRYHAFRAAQIDEIAPGDSVLYVGVGPGDDALLAARRGARVTCLDISSAMLERVATRLHKAGLAAECLREDVFEHDRPGHYDVVVINNFLGLFRYADMRAALRHCTEQVRPDGKLLIAEIGVDPTGNLAARTLAHACYGALITWNWLRQKASLHGSRDWAADCASAGLDVVDVRCTPVRRWGPRLFVSVVARRVPDRERAQLVRSYGRHPLGYSALQPDVAWFFGRGRRGAVVYRTVRGLWRRYRVVLGDPLCGGADREGLLVEFAADCAAARVGCVFAAVHAGTAGRLKRLGFRLVQMGVETSVKLGESRSWSSRAYLERQRRRRRGLDIEIEEIEPRTLAAVAPQLQRISDAWCARTLQGHELGFLTRPVQLDGDPHVRVFVARRAGQLRAFAVFSPRWWRGRVVGYYADQARAADPESNRWRSCVVAHAAAAFRREGRGRLALGYSPPYRPYAGPAPRAGEWACHRLGRAILFAVGGAWFPFGGLAAHKKRYRGEVVRVWVAFHGPAPVAPFFALVRAVGMRLWPWRRRVALEVPVQDVTLQVSTTTVANP